MVLFQNILSISLINVMDFLQGQTSSRFFPALSFDGSLSNYAAEKDASSANTVMDSYCNPQDSLYQANPIEDGRNPVGGTGIKIQLRQPRSLQIPGSAQGTASRRIRLLTEPGPDSICTDKSLNASITEEQESAVMEVRSIY